MQSRRLNESARLRASGLNEMFVFMLLPAADEQLA